jgi:hypothetical protein
MSREIIKYLDGLNKIELEKALTQSQFASYAPLYFAWLKENVQTTGEEEIIESLGSEKDYFLYNPPGEISVAMSQFLNIPRVVTMEILLNSWLIYFFTTHGEIKEDKESKELLVSSRLNWIRLDLSSLSLILAEKISRVKISRKEKKVLYSLAKKIRQKLLSI